MTDTLQHIVAVDSVHAASCDTHSTVADSTVLCADSVWIGGQSVRTVAEIAEFTPLEMLLSSPMIQSVLLLIILAYMIVVRQRYSEAVEMSSWLFYSSAVVCEERTDWRMGLPWRMLGLLTMGCVATMFLHFLTNQSVALPPIVVMTGVTTLLMSSWIVETLIIKISGEVVLQQGFARALIALRRYSVDMAGAWMTPVAVGCALSDGGLSQVLWWIVLVMSVILMFVHSLKILNLFVGARFSIFFWILYLCAVEILPKSLAVAVTLRIL